MQRVVSRPGWQTALIILAWTVASAAIVATLFWAQSILVPVALAIFFTFLLRPGVSLFEKLGVHRIVAVILVVVLVTGLIGGISWVVYAQVAALSEDLPKYSDNVKAKIREFKEMGNGGITARLEQLYLEVMTEFDSSQKQPAGPARAETTDPLPVVLEPGRHPWLTRISTVFGPMVDTLGIAALSMVLVVFMLIKREDLRNRIIRLVGHGNVTLTTKAVDEAAERISKFLVMQAIVNGTYGLALALGLYLLDVRYALLWGFFAAILRYIPYLGAWVAALFPITLSVAMSTGWSQPLMVVGLILFLELISNNVVEPSLYGQSMGVSEVALLVSAAFWAFLWGPIGMVLSSPLTVLLVVLGRHVPQFQFLIVLLGDEPALEPDVTFYQRILARDQDEAEDLALDHSKEFGLEAMFDQILIPTLSSLKRDRERKDVTEEDVQSSIESLREIIENTSDAAAERQKKSKQPDQQPKAETAAPEVDRPPVKLLACPSRDLMDELGLEMLVKILPSNKWEVEVVPAETLTSELIQLIEKKCPAVLCVGSLPPGGLAHTRSFCKRIKRRFPNIKLFVSRFGLKGNVDKNSEQLRESGAEFVTITLHDTHVQLETWHSVLAGQPQEVLIEPPKAKPVQPSAA